MMDSIKRSVAVAIGALIIGLLVPGAASAEGRQPAVKAAGAHASALTCAEARHIANLGLRRVKKITKRWRNGQVSLHKVKVARRIYKAELRQAASICSQPPGGGGGGGGGAQPLSAGEVINAITQIAKNECDIDVNCSAYGAYSSSSCDYITASQAACYGWNYEGFGDGSTCDFREIVTRTGTSGLTATRDTSYGNTSDGRFYCHF